MLAVVGLFVVAPLALLGGVLLGSNLLGESFFGTFALDLSQPAALAPALLFAASNALAEELAYRGAMRTWLAPALGVVGANLAQAVVFGLAHSGADFVGPVAPVAGSMILAGFIAGVIARRTGSLTLLIAIHAAADIPIYFFWACRVA
jgi:membrane protease YdiL (CAAX protease family)